MDKKYNVLIVHDNQRLATSIGIFLLQQGFEVGLSANSYESVVAILGCNLPHLVLIERYMNGNETEANKIVTFIDINFSLPILFITQHEEIISPFIPTFKHLFVPHPAMNSHYLAHILVGMDNLLTPDIICKSTSHFIELNVALIPLLKNGEPKLLRNGNVHYNKREVNLFTIPLMRANNLANRNTCFLWEQNNHDFCLMEITSLLKLAKRHKDAKVIRLSKFEMVMLDKIVSYKLHQTVTLDDHKVNIGKGYKKSVDAILLSIPRLN